MLGLSDDLAFTDSRPGERGDAFREARKAGARVVRVTLDWSLVAPGGGVEPASFEPSREVAPPCASVAGVLRVGVVERYLGASAPSTARRTPLL